MISSMLASVTIIIGYSLIAPRTHFEPIFLGFTYFALLIFALKQWELGLVFKEAIEEVEHP
jgi:hypothetical protein